MRSPLQVVSENPAARKEVMHNTAWWWRPPERQLEQASRLWPNAVLPKPPAEFIPQTRTEVLLLHVPDTFASLWNKVVPPWGYNKFQWEGANPEKFNLRHTPFKSVFESPTWLGFDPEHGRDELPDKFWRRPEMAAEEVFSALIQFPDWTLAWESGASVPNLSGYRFENWGAYTGVPYVFRWDLSRQLELRVRFAMFGLSGPITAANPTVRSC